MSYETMTDEERIDSFANVVGATMRTQLKEEWLATLPNDKLVDRMAIRVKLLEQLEAYDKPTEEQDQLRVQLLIELAVIAGVAVDRIGLGCY